MMKIVLSCRTELPIDNLVCFDLHQDFGLAILNREEDRFWLVLNGHTARAWASVEVKYICAVKWFAKNQVIVWLAQEWEAALISEESWTLLSIGSPDHLLVSKNNIFVTFDEEGDRGASDAIYKVQVVCAFSRNGLFEAGLYDMMIERGYNDQGIEIEAGYVFDDSFIFSLYPSECLWQLNARDNILRRIPIPISTVTLKVLWGDDKKAFGIKDNRSIRAEYPDLPAFLYATFDLETGAAVTHAFDEIETQLRAAGFDMETIRFQPNSVGKVIVSDRRRAALFDIVED